MAPTIVPPPPEAAGVVARLPEQPATSTSGSDPGAVDVDMSFEGGGQSAGGAVAAAKLPAGEATSEAGVAPTPESAPRDEGANDGGPREVDSDAVPEWAGSAPSVGLVAGLKGAPGSGRSMLFLAAGGVGVMLLAALGVALFLGNGKKRSAPEQKQAPVRAVVEPEKPAPSAQPATGEMPALPAAAVEPAKPQPAAEEKPLAPAKSQPAAAEKVVALAEKPAPAAIPVAEKPLPVEKKVAVEKVAAPAEKPAQPEKPAPAAIPAAEKPRRVEKKVAAEKPAPREPPVVQKPAVSFKPVVDKSAPERASTTDEPAAPKPEKKPTEAAATSVAKPAPNKAQEAAEAYQRGNAKLLSGALPEAIAAFSEAVKLNPKDAQSQRGLGLAYAQAGNAAKAVRHLKLYLKALPNAPDRTLIEKRIDQLGGR